MHPSRDQREITSNTPRQLFFLLTLAMLIISCSGDSSPTAPSVPACEANNTATMTFTNLSASNRSYVIAVDGVRLGNLAPGQTSPPQTFAAGVQHSVFWLFASNDKIACTGFPILAQCSSASYSCSR